MTAITSKKDVGDPTKPEGDPFSAEDLNKIIRALRFVLHILDDAQTTFQLDEALYIGSDKTAGLKTDPVSGELLIFDSKAGTVRLANLGGASFREPLYLGHMSMVGTSAAHTTNRMYLRYACPMIDVTLHKLVMRWGSYAGGGSAGNVKGAVYDTSGNVLRLTEVTAVATGGQTNANFFLPLTESLDIAAGTGVWLGVISDHAFDYYFHGDVGHALADYKDVGSFTVPDPIALPGTFATAFIPNIVGQIADGVSFT